MTRLRGHMRAIQDGAARLSVLATVVVITLTFAALLASVLGGPDVRDLLITWASSALGVALFLRLVEYAPRAVRRLRNNGQLSTAGETHE